MLIVCGVPEENVLLQQISLSSSELTQILDNTPKDIPENLKYLSQSFPERCRQDVVKSLLANDRRNGRPQVWKLGIKQRKPGPTPRCRGIRAEQREGELSVSVTGLYVPYEENFVTETTFHFCPDIACITRLPVSTNLNPPQAIHVEGTIDITDVDFGLIRLVHR